MTFSIIVPVYNAGEYLSPCLESIREAARHARDVALEVICVDDGSTDGSGAILDAYVGKKDVANCAIKVVHRSNAGVSAARNAALEMATGDWVWFVDSDDLVHPRSLSHFAAVIDQCPEAQTVCFTEFMSGVDAPTEWPPLPSPEESRLLRKHTGEMLKCHRRVVCAALVRREIIGKLRFEPYIMGEDMLFLSQIFWRTGAWAVSAAPLYFYRKHPGSAIASTSFAKVRDGLETETRILDLIEENRLQWQGLDLGEFFRFTRTFSWMTFGGMFFRLPYGEMRKLLPLWLTHQIRHQRLFRETLYRRLVVTALRVLPSARLCKVLVVCGNRIGVGK